MAAPYFRDSSRSSFPFLELRLFLKKNPFFCTACPNRDGSVRNGWIFSFFPPVSTIHLAAGHFNVPPAFLFRLYLAPRPR